MNIHPIHNSKLLMYRPDFPSAVQGPYVAQRAALAVIATLVHNKCDTLLQELLSSDEDFRATHTGSPVDIPPVDDTVTAAIVKLVADASRCLSTEHHTPYATHTPCATGAYNTTGPAVHNAAYGRLNSDAGRGSVRHVTGRESAVAGRGRGEPTMHGRESAAASREPTMSTRGSGSGGGGRDTFHAASTGAVSTAAVSTGAV